jgi:hypothetical protein
LAVRIRSRRRSSLTGTVAITLLLIGPRIVRSMLVVAAPLLTTSHWFLLPRRIAISLLLVRPRDFRVRLIRIRLIDLAGLVLARLIPANLVLSTLALICHVVLLMLIESLSSQFGNPALSRNDAR